MMKISDFLAMKIGELDSMKLELMRVADESLYKAKNNGKNQVVITEI